MKILHISTYDINGGAAKSAYRLHKILQNSGIESEMLVLKKFSYDESVHESQSFLIKLLPDVFSQIDAIPRLFYPKRVKSNFTTAWLPLNILHDIKNINPDIVHIHWVSGFIDLKTFVKISKPLICSMHDMWLFTGGCHYSGECNEYVNNCGKCPQLKSSNQNDLSANNLKRKKKLWNRAHFNVISPSAWLKNCLEKSSLKQVFNCELIPYAIDSDLYKKYNKGEVRLELELSSTDKIILFGAIGGLQNTRKGSKLLPEIINKLLAQIPDCHFLVFGASESDSIKIPNEKITFLGNIHDEILLAKIYSAADVYIMPSLEDNLPNTILESMSCGTPCVAFSIGGIPDMIEHKTDGYLAKPFDIEDFTSGVIWNLNQIENTPDFSLKIQSKIKSKFSESIVVKQYSDLIKRISSTH